MNTRLDRGTIDKQEASSWSRMLTDLDEGEGTWMQGRRGMMD